MATTSSNSSSLVGESEKAEGSLTPPPGIDNEATLRNNSGTERTSALELLQKIQSNSDAHPSTWPVWKKWLIVFIYCLLEVFVTLTSTTYVSAEFLIQEKFPASTQVITLGQSMFIVGNAVGPCFLGMTRDLIASETAIKNSQVHCLILAAANGSMLARFFSMPF